MPENIQTWEVFTVMASQLRVGGIGTIIGLDLAPFTSVCDAFDVDQEDRAEMLKRVMELGRIGMKYWGRKQDKTD